MADAKIPGGLKVKRTCVALILVVLLGACSLGPDGPLEQASKNLANVKSGEIKLSLAAATIGGAKGGFELEGLFAIPEGGSLPMTNLKYRRIGVQDRQPLSFVSTGRAAYVQVGPIAYKLPEERARQFRGSKEAGSAGPFDGLEIDDWVPEPKTSSGPQVDGVATRKITGRLDVPAALGDIFDMAREFAGDEVPELKGRDRRQLGKAVKSGRLEMLVGSKDKIVRSLHLDVTLGADGPKKLTPKLRELLGANFDLTMEIKKPNSRIRVSEPANPQPFSKLQIENPG